MDTIKERAEEFAQNFHIVPRGFDCGNCNTCTKCKDYNRFVDIVIKQKEIDIEMASEWLKRNMKNYFEISNKYMDASIDPICEFLEDFRKVMEK